MANANQTGTEITFRIVTNPKLSPWGRIYSLCFIMAIIGPGVLLDSEAMQWVGFIIICIAVVGMASAHQERNKGMSITQARKRLDEIEKNEAYKEQNDE